MEDGAPQRCGSGADATVKITRDGFDAEAAPAHNSNPSRISLLRAKNGLDNGVHFRVNPGQVPADGDFFF